MSQPVVTKNAAVYITYSILDQSGQVVERSDLPIGYVQGADSGIFERAEEALMGARVGDRIEVTLSPEQGFGRHDPGLTFTDDIDNVPPEYRHLGAEVEFHNDRGEAMMFRVTKIENGKLTIDANHPFAGQTVRFVVTVVAIREATPDEIANGRPDDGAPPTLH